MRLLDRLLHGVIDADPIALGVCVAGVVAAAVALWTMRLRRRAP